MRNRISYIIKDPQSFELSQLEIEGQTMSVKSLVAAKEHRLTLGLEELPIEVVSVVTQCHEVHVRWVKPTPYNASTPFVSRAAPGLHVHYTPSRSREPTRLCGFLKKIFGEDVKCETPTESFTRIPVLAERFTHSSASQFYQFVPSLKDLLTYVQEKVCMKHPPTNNSCALRTAQIMSASYVDMDFDVISRTLVLHAFWDKPLSEDGWTEEQHVRGPGDVTEVGVLNEEKATSPEEVSLGGFLTTLGVDKKPSATLFSFPSRHRDLPKNKQATFSASFKQPSGLHPVLQLHFSRDMVAPMPESCVLHTYLNLPSYLFVDRYQLQDPLFLASNNLKALHSLSGETDLEAPDWVTKKWGSAALLELVPPTPPSSTPPNDGNSNANDIWTVSIPLHLRYLPPTRGRSGLTPVPAPWPVAFWACPAEEGTKMTVNPFDRKHLGYDALFGPRTVFFHVPPAPPPGSGEGLVESVVVPVLDLDRAGYVRWGTLAAVVLGAVWVAWKLVVAVGAVRERRRREEDKRVKSQ